MNNRKLNIVMFSSADSVAGQGVGSAYTEQVSLVRDGASDLFNVYINKWLQGSRYPAFSYDWSTIFR